MPIRPAASSWIITPGKKTLSAKKGRWELRLSLVDGIACLGAWRSLRGNGMQNGPQTKGISPVLKDPRIATSVRPKYFIYKSQSHTEGSCWGER